MLVSLQSPSNNYPCLKTTWVPTFLLLDTIWPANPPPASFKLQTKFGIDIERLTPFNTNCITFGIAREYPGEMLSVYEAKYSKLISLYKFWLHFGYTSDPRLMKYLRTRLATPNTCILSFIGPWSLSHRSQDVELSSWDVLRTFSAPP